MDNDDWQWLINRRPWVNGDKFIGPSIKNLLLAYYITQGESHEQAWKFVVAHLDALRNKR